MTPMSEQTELKPCPFCGGTPSIVNVFSGNSYVSCDNCHAQSNDLGTTGAIAAWNRRPQAGAAGEAVAWRSIKTAPKDGTHIIGSNDDDTAFVCAWFPDDDCGGGYWLEWGTDLVNPTRWIPMPSAAPLVPPTPAGAVTVKALEWKRSATGGELTRADSILGIYRVWTHHEANGKWFWDNGISHSEVADEAAGHAAAQADYEARIRSALATPASPDNAPNSVGKTQAIDLHKDAGCRGVSREDRPTEPVSLQDAEADDLCPFCRRDPYHYVDNGVGMERVAVTCCELGIALFQHGDEQAIEVTNRLRDNAARIEADAAALAAMTADRDMQVAVVECYSEEQARLLAEIRAAKEREQMLREALKPFADEAARRDQLCLGPDIDHWPLRGHSLTLGHVRLALAALAHPSQSTASPHLERGDRDA